jgi:hypothetical protein
MAFNFHGLQYLYAQNHSFAIANLHWLKLKHTRFR